jgi:hypothetical protein
MASKVEFSFRAWVHPINGDPPGIEVWYAGLEATEPGKGLVSDWARESLRNEDMHELFELDGEKHWQVVGRCTLHGWFDYFGEYDEELDLIEYAKAEVPEVWLYGKDLPLDESA